MRSLTPVKFFHSCRQRTRTLLQKLAIGGPPGGVVPRSLLCVRERLVGLADLCEDLGDNHVQSHT